MSANYVVGTIGRRLRLGVVGGGPGSFIGSIHRGAALMNEQYEVIAAVLSSDAARSTAYAAALGIPRGYDSAREMIEAETAREDGIDVIAIMTPNNSHYEIARLALESGLHVICEKPLTNHYHEAISLAALVNQTGLQFCVAYGYAGYPMVRQAKAMVEAGDLGEIRMIQCNYVQGHLAEMAEDEKNGTNWHMLPEVAGENLIVADIGTHCYHLCSYVTGMQPEQLSADSCTMVPGRTATDYTSIQLRYANGARGSLWVTQAAAGAEHGLYLRVFGSKGGIEWHQEYPNELLFRSLDQPAQVFTKGGPGLYESAKHASAVTIGHPEGYREAFATLYRDFAEAVTDALTAQASPKDPLLFPQIEDGVQGVRFIEAAEESNRGNGFWVQVIPKYDYSMI